MIQAVAKASYLRGRTAKAKAKAHVRYIEERPGKDRGREGREFFDRGRQGISRQEIYGAIESQDDRRVVCHKLILSPGIEGADVVAYTRETMEQLGREKGLELSWYAVEHRNTEHQHAHVVIMGRSEDGHQVRIDRDDLRFIRQRGDRYLEREHVYDRYLDSEIQRILDMRARREVLEYDRDRGDRQFESLFGGRGESPRQESDAGRDRRDWELFDEDLHKWFEKRERGLEKHKSYSQWNLEQSGRLSDFHERMTAQQEKERLAEQSRSEDPEVAEAAQRDLLYVEALEAQMREQYDATGVEDLLGWTGHERTIVDASEERPFEGFELGLKDLDYSLEDRSGPVGVNVIDLFGGGGLSEAGVEREADVSTEMTRDYGAITERHDDDDRDRDDLI